MLVFNSTVSLTGNISFTNNSSPRGGGMMFQSRSTLLFNPPLQLYAGHNMANEGAAIFVEDVITYNICLPIDDPYLLFQEDPVYCFFTATNSSSGQVHLLFENNAASVAGTTLYGGMLDTCPFRETQFAPGTTALDVFHSISETLQSRQDITAFIASDPLMLCFCYENKPNCSI